MLLASIMRYILYIILFAQISILSGCKDITEIQRQYVADRDGCVQKSKDEAGVYLDTYPSNSTTQDRSNIINEAFCECMHEHGWHAARTLFDPYPECPKSSTEGKK